VLHELWDEGDEGLTFCLAGPMGDGARRLLGAGARIVEARSHFEAMSRYHEHMGWGEYSTDYPEFDMQPYSERGWE
jgi:hypothetical protein